MDIRETMKNNYSFFQLRKDATGMEGLNTLQKYTAAFRQLAYGMWGDSVVEYLKMGERTAVECLKQFSQEVVECYKDNYLRPPNKCKTKIVLQRTNVLGFYEMLGLIYCCKRI